MAKIPMKVVMNGLRRFKEILVQSAHNVCTIKFNGDHGYLVAGDFYSNRMGHFLVELILQRGSGNAPRLEEQLKFALLLIWRPFSNAHVLDLRLCVHVDVQFFHAVFKDASGGT